MADSPEPTRDLEEVFREFHDEVSRQSAIQQAETRYRLGLAYRDMGMTDAALRELEQATRVPHLRFEASALLGRLLRDRGDLVPAVEWFERAAEAPAPSPDEGRGLLYDLARTLERAGEGARALAVYLELQTDDESYRDVGERVEQLKRLQAGR